MHTADKEVLAARQVEVTRLQLEIDQNRRYRPAVVEPPIASYRPAVLEPPIASYRPQFEPPIASYRPAVVEPPRAQAVPFDLEEMPMEELPLSELSEGELRSRLEKLSKEKAEDERKLNLAAPPGAKLTQIRMQKQELEDEVVRLGGLISRIRLEMRRRQFL
jgi:hypothetical protein